MPTLSRNEELWRLRAVFSLGGIVCVNTLHVIPIPYTPSGSTVQLPGSGQAALQWFRLAVGAFSYGRSACWSYDGVCLAGKSARSTLTPIVGKDTSSNGDGSAISPGPLALPILCEIAGGPRRVTRFWGPAPAPQVTNPTLNELNFTDNRMQQPHGFSVNNAFTVPQFPVFAYGTPRYKAVIWRPQNLSYELISAASFAPWWTTSIRRRVGPFGPNAAWDDGRVSYEDHGGPLGPIGG